MKKVMILLAAGLLQMGVVNGQNSQDSLIITSGVIDKNDAKIISKNLKSQVKEGNLRGSLNSANSLGRKLSNKELETIIKESSRLGRLETASEAAKIIGRSLTLKEIKTILTEKEYVIDSLLKYCGNISSEDAKQLEKYYIDRGDLYSSERLSIIAGRRMSNENYIKISQFHFREKSMDTAIIAAKGGGELGRRELGKLLLIFINIKDKDNAIKAATAIGGRNMSVREWALIKTIIPTEDIIEVIDEINGYPKNTQKED